MSIQNLNTFGESGDSANLKGRRKMSDFCLVSHLSPYIWWLHFLRLNVASIESYHFQCEIGLEEKSGIKNIKSGFLYHCPNFLLNIQFFSFILDPFADAVGTANEDVQDGLVHIRIQQRNGRKTLTTVQGLSSNYDLKKIVRSCKKASENSDCVWFVCNAIFYL